MTVDRGIGTEVFSTGFRAPEPLWHNDDDAQFVADLEMRWAPAGVNMSTSRATTTSSHILSATRVSGGCGFIKFMDEAGQQRALIEMHGCIVCRD
uniref:RRM domain-containing protein n=1 Tax=Mycena chlorophos TaxID=658473 RepID=A0ABQ0LER3_MYCCL|nr:predicted protein [Mycena chlorophos]